MDIKAEAKKLVRNLAGRIGPSAYDIAWMARLPADNGDGRRWPELIDWLVEHQWPDGSWGGAIPYHHDRILCTLTAIIALREQETDPNVSEAIRRGEQYIWNNLHFLHHDPIELVGFELILPTLLAQARGLDLDVPSHSCGYGRIRAAKLHLLPMEMLYTPGTSVAFSLEFLDTQGDAAAMRQLQGENGAIANSPATTAYLALQGGGDGTAMGYLERMRARTEGVPAFYPFRTFEAAWVLEHLAFGELPLDELVEPPLWAALQASLTPTGTGIDPLFGINDGDTTSVTLHVLALGGQPVDPDILRTFEEPEKRTFRTFGFERNASVVTNAHALEALSLMPDYPDRQDVWDHIVATLLGNQIYQSYWVDKWHASPYYATAHALIALIDVQEPLLTECMHSIDWLLHTQREDGSWGYFDRSTAEETAYALLALLHYHRRVSEVNIEVLQRGMVHLLAATESQQTPPELWIAKTLYAPGNIVQAANLAVLALYEDTIASVSD